jgi:uncharacterized phage protein (TIGR02218 family)
MKSLPPALQSHLDSGTTTLAWCWRLTRGDGLVQGFTDHDRDLAFDGITFAAATGFTATEIKDAVGLAVDNLEVESALSSDSLNEDDLAAGLFDDAAIEIWRVNWADTDQRVLMRSGSLGEVRRAGSAFAAEVRGLAHYLQQPKGRLFQYACDVDLGDARCTVDLDDPAFKGAGTVVAATGLRHVTAGGLAAFADGLFTRGLLTFTSGANAGRAQTREEIGTVRVHDAVQAGAGFLCRGRERLETGGSALSNTRVLHIGIAPRDYIHKRMLDIAKGARRQGSDEPCIWFTSAEALARVLSRKNMLLIEMIRRAEPASVTELAERVGRTKTNVLRSLKTLKQFDIVDFEDGEGGRKAPRLNYDDFRVDGRLGGDLKGKAA